MSIEQNLFIAHGLNLHLSLKNRMRGKPSLAHHGLQRAGTNYTAELLTMLDCRPVNFFRTANHSLRHKHTRWNIVERSKIPFIEKAFPQTPKVTSIASLNRVAGFPLGCRHIVVKKELAEWCISIVNFSLRSRWFDTVDVALLHLDDFIGEYQEFHVSWSTFFADEPESCQIVTLESIRNDCTILPTALSKMGLKPIVPIGFDGSVSVVNMSPKGRKAYLAESQIEQIRRKCKLHEI